MTDLPLTLKEAAAALRAKQLTSLEITTEMLRKTKALNPELGAFLVITEESAMAEAAAADEKFAAGIDLGPLQGIPYCTKDIIATKDAPTTANSLILDREWGKGWDAPVVSRMRAAGAVHMGKTSLSEFACGLPDVTKGWPMPRNPWDPERSPAGSSSGTGIAVSAGMVYCGFGTDTGGSIRAPGSANGHTAIKATFGRVPKSGCVPLGYSLDNIGPHARSAWDAAAMLNVIAGYDASDPCAADEPVEDYTAGLDGNIAGLRVALPMNYFFENATPETYAAVMAGVEVL
ncbi:MAG TPA: amidase, partial [Tepidiformaceae bacterium]|nr:amidase [Tepidiformaceae bacterium]